MEKKFSKHKEAKSWLEKNGYKHSPRFTYDSTGTGTYIDSANNQAYATFYKTGKAVIDIDEPKVTESFDAELLNLQKLAGVHSLGVINEYADPSGLTQYPASEKARIQKERNIRPGDKEWFRLWFAKPGTTGEKPY